MRAPTRYQIRSGVNGVLLGLVLTCALGPPVTLAATPILKGINFNGINESTEISEGVPLIDPPDPHGAVGPTQYVQVVNSQMVVFSRQPPAGSTVLPVLKSVTLASFFGYFQQPLFDPRVVYDTAYGRWIMTAAAFHESSSVQRHFIAVSQTSDATGSYFMYKNINVDFLGDGKFWDFPQLGLSRNAVLITANIYSCQTCSSSALYSALLSAPKQALYDTVFQGVQP